MVFLHRVDSCYYYPHFHSWLLDYLHLLPPFKYFGILKEKQNGMNIFRAVIIKFHISNKLKGNCIGLIAQTTVKLQYSFVLIQVCISRDSFNTDGK